MKPKLIFNKLFSHFGQALTINKLMQVSKCYTLLPFYHCISNKRLPHINNLYLPRSIEQFENDLDFFCKYYTPIDADQLKNLIDKKLKPDKPNFHLTFDDGLSQIYDVVAPILLQRGIPATIFLNSDFVDNKNLFYRYKCSLLIEKIQQENNTISFKEISIKIKMEFSSKQELIRYILNLSYNDSFIIDQLAIELNCNFQEFLEKEQPYLNSFQVKNLATQGFNVGAHSIDHPLFRDIDVNEQKRQISNSFNYIKNKFNIEAKYFAFPFTDNGINSSLLEWLFKEEKCDLSFGTAGLKSDNFSHHLQRISMEGTNQSASKIIKQEYVYYLAKMLFNRNVSIRND